MAEQREPELADVSSGGTPRPEPLMALDAFVGIWRARVSVWVQPGDEPHLSVGRMVNRWVRGHRFLEQRYAGDAGDFEGRGYLGHNAARQCYEGFWIDTASSAMQIEAGEYNPETETHTMEGTVVHPITGETITRTTAIHIDGPDRHVMEVYMHVPIGRVRVMEIVYERETASGLPSEPN